MKNMMRKFFRYLIIVFINFLVIIILGEIIFRLVWKDDQTDRKDERNLTYKYDLDLGWFPLPNSTKQFKGCRSITVKNNKDGFRDIDHNKKTKKRILFLGDSFVWGYDVEQHERFTEKLQALLPNWEVLNLGVSGYGTDQEYILIQKWFRNYKPDVVVLVFCQNDWKDNSSNMSYGYYKPYFEYIGNKLIEKGAPVRKSMNYYISENPFIFKSFFIKKVFAGYLKLTLPKLITINDPTSKIVSGMKNYIESQGAKFIIAFTHDTDEGEVCPFCGDNTGYVFLTNNFTYEGNGYHWTPEGHDYVCRKLYRFLLNRNYLN